jgi:hypothetical protein
MPSNIPPYVYSLFASLIVGAIIVSSCCISMLNIRNAANNQQLTNIDRYVATQSLILLSHANEENQNITQFLDVPSSVGNQIYWICISNDSSGAWVSSGFGTTAILGQPRIYIPAQFTASGVFVSSFSRAFLRLSIKNQTATLTLTGSNLT